jgi:hypothetical protein
MLRNVKGLATVAGLLFLLVAPQAEAEFKPGVRGGAYFDASKVFLGAEVLAPLQSNWYLNPNFEYVFFDNATFFTANFDVHYDLPTRGSYYIWVGGGLAILYFNPDGPAESNTDPGLNLFMGIGFDTDSRLIPYIQPKVIISDNSEFALAFGLRF